MAIVDNDISLKRQLVEVTDAVRRKFNSVKRRHLDNQLTLEKIYEPITKPLKLMSAAAMVAKPPTTQSPPTPLSLPAQSYPPSVTSPLQKTQAMDDKYESTPCSQKNNDSSDDSDEDHDQNNTSQISFMDTPPSSSFIASPSESESSTIQSSATQNMSDVVRNHIKNLKSGNAAYDILYGVRVNPYARRLQMGELEIRFPGQNIELWTGKKKLATYQGSPTLYDAIFLRFPSIINDDGDFVENFDAETYGEILKKTRAPYKNYDRKKGLNASSSMKYRKIIKPLISYQITTRSHHTGEGLPPKLPTMKVYNNTTAVDYVYWNKPKELIARLRLLWSSKLAGHTGHENEILSIIEELKEEGIIY